MAGRAGRSYSGGIGNVDVFLLDDDFDDVKEGLVGSGKQLVNSFLGEISNVAFHLLPEVSRGNVYDVRTAMAWHKNSFHAFQGGLIDFEKVFDYLVELEVVEVRDGKFCSTKMGDISTSFYFRPEDVYAWKDNFEQVFDLGVENEDMAIVWALANVPREVNSRSSWKAKEGKIRCLDEINVLGFDIDDSKMGAALSWLRILGGFHCPDTASYSKVLKKDFGRVLSALKMLDVYRGWDMEDFFNRLQVQVSYSVGSELYPLVMLEGIGKVYAQSLYNMGVTSGEDLVECFSQIESECDPRLVKTVERLIHDIS